MNITLKIDEDTVKKVRKIAIDKNTTLAQMVRDFLTQIAQTENAKRKRSSQRFKHLTKKYSRPMDLESRSWTREDLHGR